MAQGGLSIISPTGITENSGGKMRATLTSGPTLQSAREKFNAKWIKELFQEDCCSVWETMRLALAEFLGTNVLIFIGCMGCVGSLGNAPPSLQSALGFGLTVMIIILSIGHISDAHINPAITVGAVVLGKKSLRTAAVYWVAQCLGATTGYGLLKVVTPWNLLYGTAGQDTSEMFCVTAVNEDLSLIQGFLVEVIATAIIMFMTCGMWDVRNERNTDSGAIKFGLAVTVLSSVVGPYTGCSMNPARSLGPAVWNNSWNYHWLYWFGPIGGSLLASITYRTIFAPIKCNNPEERSTAPTREELKKAEV